MQKEYDPADKFAGEVFMTNGDAFLADKEIEFFDYRASLSSKLSEIKDVYFIRLGGKGDWAEDCFKDGVIRLGFDHIPHQLCRDKRWDEVKRLLKERYNKTEGVATSHANSLRRFYEADETSVFITFKNQKMFWCRPGGGVSALEDGGRMRPAKAGWSDQDIKGGLLSIDRLSGALTKTNGYRDTFCSLDRNMSEYAILKIRGEMTPAQGRFDDAADQYRLAIQRLLRRTTWKDFELLVELIFSQSGWRRISATGGTQETTDLDLMLPTTSERAIAQIKASADENELKKYLSEFSGLDADRMFFVWHSGKLTHERAAELLHEWAQEQPRHFAGAVTLMGPEQVAEAVEQAGLGQWLKNNSY